MVKPTVSASKSSKSSPNPAPKPAQKADDDPPLLPDPPAEDQRIVQLEQEIQSKERTLALLDGKLPGDAQLQMQLADRDKFIEKLNGKILALEAKQQSAELTSSAAKDKQIRQLHRERADLTRQVSQLEERLLRAESETADLKAAFQKEKGEFELLSEALTEETEGLKTQLKVKDESLQSAKHDVLEMSRIVKELSVLNSEFNEKVLQMNNDVETHNKDLFSAQAKAKQMEECEKELLAAKTENRKLRRRSDKLIQMKAELVAMEEGLKLARESLKPLETALSRSSFPEKDGLLDALQRHKAVLSRKIADRTVSDDPILLQDEIRNLKQELAEKDSECNKQAAVHSTITARIAEVEREKETAKRDLMLSNEKLQRRVKLYQESLEKFRGKCEQLESDYEQAEKNFQKAQTLVVSLQSQLAVVKAKKSAEAAAETQYEGAIRELKSQLAAVKAQKLTAELSINNREAVLKAHAMQLKLLQDQIWKKDTELIRAGKLQGDDSEERKLTHREAGALQKVKSAADLSSASMELESKDREIAMLKDLLKSTSQQLKAKEGELARAKKRIEKDSPVSASSEDSSVFSLLQEYDEVQVAMERVDTEAKIPKQAVRTALKAAAVIEDKEEAVTALKKRLGEICEKLETVARKNPKMTVTMRSNVLLNSSKLRELSRVSDQPLSQLLARLRP